jgi:uroporphyrinogen-III synthase
MPEVTPFVVCTFESRRAEEMCSLISRQGCQPLSAPSMREIPIEHNPEAIEIIQGFLAGKFDAIVLLTGVGTEALFDVARSQGLYDQLIEVLAQTPIIIRGPKTSGSAEQSGFEVCCASSGAEYLARIADGHRRSKVRTHRQANCRAGIRPAEYSTVHRIAEPRRDGHGLSGLSLGSSGEHRATRSLPSARRPKEKLMLCCSPVPIRSAVSLTVAERIGVLDQFRAATSGRTLVISIGPTCSEALDRQRFPGARRSLAPQNGTTRKSSL